MRFTVFVLLVFFASCSANFGQRFLYGNNIYHPIFRQRYGYPPVTTPTNPGTTPTKMKLSEDDDRQASEKGVKILPDECFISWDQFKRHIDGRDLIDMYGINNDDSFVPGAFFKLSAVWTVTNETTAGRRGSVW